MNNCYVRFRLIAALKLKKLKIMSIEGSISELKNIPTNALVVVGSSFDIKSCKIKQFTNGIIALTGFAICQFLEGAELIANKPSGCFRSETLLILRLAKSMGTLNHVPAVEITVDYRDLTHLRSWLEARMQHCEQERDARTLSPSGDGTHLKFNADTYIGMKLLLLDLRELMLGELV